MYFQDFSRALFQGFGVFIVCLCRWPSVSGTFTIPLQFEKMIEKRSSASIRLPILHQEIRLDGMVEEFRQLSNTQNAIRLFNLCHESEDMLATCLSISNRDKEVEKALLYSDVYSQWIPMLHEQLPNIIITDKAIPSISFVSADQLIDQFHSLMKYHIQELSAWTTQDWIKNLQQNNFFKFHFTEKVAAWFAFSTTLLLNVKRILNTYRYWHQKLYEDILPKTVCLEEVYFTAHYNRMKFSTFTHHIISVMKDSLQFDTKVVSNDRIALDRSLDYLLKSFQIIEYIQQFTQPSTQHSPPANVVLSKEAILLLNDLNYRTSADCLRAANNLLLLKQKDSKFSLIWNTAKRLIQRHAFDFPSGNRVLIDILSFEFQILTHVVSWLEIEHDYARYRSVLSFVHPYPQHTFVTLDIFNNYVWSVYGSMKFFFNDDDDDEEIPEDLNAWADTKWVSSDKTTSLDQDLYYSWYRFEEAIYVVHEDLPTGYGNLKQVWDYVFRFIANHLSSWKEKIEKLKLMMLQALPSLQLHSSDASLIDQINLLNKPMIEVVNELFLGNRKNEEKQALSPSTQKRLVQSSFYIVADYDIYLRLLMQDKTLLYEKTPFPASHNRNQSSSSKSLSQSQSKTSSSRHFRFLSSSRRSDNPDNQSNVNQVQTSQMQFSHAQPQGEVGGYWSD